MTVLFFTRLFYPHIGGVEKHVLEISKILVEKGHFVTVLTEKFERCLLDTDEIDGIKILRINNGKDDWFKKFRAWKNLWKYRKLIKESDIVHAHDVFFWYLPFRFLYPRKPAYTTFHGYETNFPPSQKSIIIRKITEKLSWGNICVGDYIRKWYGAKTTHITYGGVENFQISNIKSHVSSPISKAKISFIGRLDKDTGIDIYLKALAILKQKKIKFEFDVFGNGVFRKQAEKVGKVYGFIKDLSHSIEDSNIIFASSYLSMLQALALGKIVIAVYTNPLREDYLRDSPFVRYILIFNNEKDIVSAISSILNESYKFESMKKNGQEWARKQAWKKVVLLYLDLWKI